MGDGAKAKQRQRRVLHYVLNQIARDVLEFRE
jgi:hypothetical protein